MNLATLKNLNSFQKVIIGIAAIVLFFIFLFSPLDFSNISDRVLSMETSLPSMTVINPIRGSQLGLEHADLLASLKGQWQVTNEEKVNATWLWQYSALEDEQRVAFAKSAMKKQEFGIFLEIDRNFAQKAGVLYRGNGPWYFSDGLLLVSYDEAERKRLIDTVFTKFKKTFGYYPKSVGAWWVGGDSLAYMHDRYGVIASLQVADQFDLDTYSVWGTPWSIPYVPSVQNAAIPASSPDKSSHVVVMQWAPRDPTYAYGDTQKYSTYSMQDYELKHYSSNYASYLMTVFLKKPFDQVVIGLESGFPAGTYSSMYRTHLQLARDLQKQHKVVVETAGQFAGRFLVNNQMFGGSSYNLADAYDTNSQSFWYNSAKYRLGIQKKGDAIFLVDLRDYSNAGAEDFSLLPNSQGFLRIASPVIVDSALFPEDKLLLTNTKDKLEIADNNGEIILSSGNKQIARITPDTLFLPVLSESYLFNTQKDFTDIFFVLFISLIFYMILFFIIQKQKKAFFKHFFILTLCLFIALPFMTHGPTNQALVFDKKELILFPLLNLIPLSFPIRFVFLFQILPFIILIIGHLLFIFLGIGKKRAPYYYSIVVGFFLMLYLHIPDEIANNFIMRKKVVFVVGIVLYLFVAAGSILLYLYKKKGKKKIKKIIIFTCVGFVLFVSTLFFSWQKYVITPFESKALLTMRSMHQDVIAVQPKEKPHYRVVSPLLLESSWFGKVITHTNWQEVVRPEGKFLTLTNLDNKIVFVPRYLGAELYPEEIEKYKLKKVFDNAQIAIFTR